MIANNERTLDVVYCPDNFKIKRIIIGIRSFECDTNHPPLPWATNYVKFQVNLRMVSLRDCLLQEKYLSIYMYYNRYIRNIIIIC